jgi:hypothetical protein
MRNPAKMPDNVEVSKLTSRSRPGKVAMSIRSPREKGEEDFRAATLVLRGARSGHGASNTGIMKGANANRTDKAWRVVIEPST